MIAIVDYGLGNTQSVFNALDYLGIDAIITRKPEELRNADRFILPGVGAFGQSMHNLNQYGLRTLLQEEVVIKKKPFMGICLGMQVLADYGFEKGCHEGFGWIKGSVRPLEDKCKGLKVPHVGWNEIRIETDTPLLSGIGRDKCFYFVHSYYFDALNRSDVAAVCEYGEYFPCVLVKGNVFATQFHPEKSQKNGLKVLENFSQWSVE